ncbi:putative toxin-antitoxin system toxin component, PIN family [Uliginosibacterium sp. H3]|uniref:Toxin-antitoxin system toxin component, PIN family n=1 Tax=Uliginosibacterium silvisoli TaxID=3114758 RepID=A0ABU6K162_9RHOO|nr:putative toxin-antitoxin system toxin component, PIN family [Uliginosibacterium sp. H3]
MHLNPLPLPPEETPLRVVLDTNVIMAFWHFRDPKLLNLLAWLESRQVVLLTRQSCLHELERVLAYVQFGIAPDEQVRILADYAARSECLADPTEEQLLAAQALPKCRDKDDQKFIELAWDGAAHLLLTRDKLLLGMARRPPLRDQTNILSPERLIKKIEELV